MGILQVYTFDRNALKGDEQTSRRTVVEHLALALGPPVEFTKNQSNVVGALRNYLGILRKGAGGTLELTEVGEVFQDMYSVDPVDAWRWLLTRGLWKYVVPNGTDANVNKEAAKAGVEFNFFRTMLQALVAMSSQPGGRRFIYYQELVPILADDDNWKLSGDELFSEIVARRRSGEWSESEQTRKLIGDLEPAYGIKKDNLSSVLHKAMGQTGLFSHRKYGRAEVGIALADDLDRVRQRRIRHLLDHEPVWTPE
jgi:hypothetical protein